MGRKATERLYAGGKEMCMIQESAGASQYSTKY